MTAASDEYGMLTSVPDTGHQHDAGYDDRREAHDVRVEDRQIRAYKSPYELRRKISEAVAYHGKIRCSFRSIVITHVCLLLTLPFLRAPPDFSPTPFQLQVYHIK